MNYFDYIILALLAVSVVLNIITLVSAGKGKNLADKLRKAIFSQRPLKSQKGLVGTCTFEKGKARCSSSHPLYEDFRMYSFINNIKVQTPKDDALRNLTDEEKKIACELSVKAGTDFVKTSTGFGTGGSTPQDIKLMRDVVGPEIGVKASGGVRSREQAVEFLNQGADRIGTSHIV